MSLVRSTAATILLCSAVLWSGAAAAQAERTPFTIAYVGLEDDPHYREVRAYTGLTLRQPYRPLDGAAVALRESRVIGRSLGLSFELAEAMLDAEEDVVAAMEGLIADRGIAVFVLDLPLETLTEIRDYFAGRDLILMNPRHRDSDLREAGCAANLFHTLASHRMLTDALAQFLFMKGWRSVLLLEGPEPGDHTLSAAFQDSADRFRLEIAGVKDFLLSNDPRNRDRTNIPILTRDPDHDVVFVADTLGEFGRYLPYRTFHPRPVVGSEGLVASGWHWTWERHGAPQLNQRFDRRAGRHMTDTDWAGWAAIRIVVEAMVKSRSTDTATLRETLVSPDLTFDSYKGAPVSFRPWNHQLRQPILLHVHNAVVARAPVEGFLHQTNTLDTLGVDARETDCEMDWNADP